MSPRLPMPIVADETPTVVLEGLTQLIPVIPGAVPKLPDGVELVGEYSGSGYREPPQLVVRQDRQLVRLPPLLYQLVKLLAGRPLSEHVTPPPGGYVTTAQIADALGRETGSRLTAEHIVFLVDKKLAPLGITTYSDGSAPPLPEKANPFLAFRFRATVVSEKMSWFLSGLFSWMYQPLVIVLGLAAFAVCELWVGLSQDMGGAMRDVLLSPANLLLIVGLTMVSAAFHEVGHAAACRYGGARPGSMGCGIYLVWPAFYTDITDSYRLGRAGRLRADLGGVYFNGLFVVALTALYLWTGFTPLLVAILAVNLEIIQQLLPTLRFDGYYIISDLVGIPDLFKYIGPILKRVFLNRPDARLAELKRWPQRVVAAWVLLVVPALILQLGLLAMHVPGLLQLSWQHISTLAANIGTPGNSGLAVAAVCVQILFMLLPVLGLGLLAGRLLLSLFRLLRRASAALAGYVSGRIATRRDQAERDDQPDPENAEPTESSRPANDVGSARHRRARVLDVIGTVARLGLAAVWIVSGVIKLLDPGQTYLAVKAYDVLPTAMIGPVADALPLVGLFLGVLILVGIGVRLNAALSAALLLVFLVAVSQAWMRGLAIDCGCFGGGGEGAADDTRYGQELLRDAAFLALAGWLVLRPRTWASLDAIIIRRTPTPDTDTDTEPPPAPRSSSAAGPTKPAPTPPAA